MQARLSLRRTSGFCLTLGSILLLLSIVPVVIPLGASVTWLAIWAASAGIFLGCFMMFELEFKKFIGPLFVGILSLLTMNVVFLAPISFDLQLLLAALFLVIVALLSRFYLRHKS